MPLKARFRPDEAHKALNDIKTMVKTAKAAEREVILWHFSIRQSVHYPFLLSPSVQDLAYGERSISSRDTDPTIPAQMLMYGKEASNRKQEIDRQHYTIPNQRPKDKHCGKI